MTEPKKPPPFTADNLPEAARATMLDPTARFDNGMPLNLDGYTARVLNRLDAAHNGRLSALLNGTAPVATDAEMVEVAAKILYEDAMSYDRRAPIPAWVPKGNALAQTQARWVAEKIARLVVSHLHYTAHRPAADPVRFALEKVSYGEWEGMIRDAAYVDQRPNGLNFVAFSEVKLIDNLAKILPVAETKQWAELTDEALIAHFRAAVQAFDETPYTFGGKEHYMAAASSLRASLSAHAPPPAKGETIAYITKAALKSWAERASDDPQSHVFLSSGGELRVPLYASPQPPRDQHPDDAAVDRFAAAMKAKLAKKREEGRGGWDDPARCSVEDLARMLVEHLPKGDPVDVANFAMMLFCRDGGDEAFKAAYAPRKVEVTVEAIDAAKQEYNAPRSCWHNIIAAALAVANTQANARESEEVARLTNDARAYETGLLAERDLVERLNAALENVRKTVEADAALIEMANETNDRLTKERDLARNTGDEAFKALVALRTHTDALEALLTVPGADGPVKLWLPFERSLEGAYWESATLALGYSPRGVPQGCLDRAAMRRVKLRQTPAPEAELKRWRVRLMLLRDDIVLRQPEVTTDPMTRANAEKIGEVIGPVD